MSNKNFFSLDNLEQGIKRALSDGVEAHVFPGEQAMISVVKIAPNHRGKLHAHPEEQWGVLLEGGGTRIQGGEEIPVKAGDFWCTPGEMPHTFQAGPDGATVIDVFAPPREEYRKAGSGFGKGAEQE